MAAKKTKNGTNSRKKNGDVCCTYNQLIKETLKFNPNANKELIKKAYDLGYEAHKNQKRESGEPFFNHPLEVARLLIELRADSATICTALLHDTVEESKTTIEQIEKEFGKEIAELVEGVTKITDVKFETKEAYQAENLRKVLLATAKDIRVMLVKLADRLHNMRTLKYFREEKRRRIAAETLNIYAPIAHKLGIRAIKGELEDLALKNLDPDSYKKLRKSIASKREEREEGTKQFINIINKKLKEHGIDAEIEGRAKYFYSIYQKMKREGKDFNEIYDLIALRIITKTIPDCYAALGIVHESWKPIPKRFKDYISVPKANGYQSLHTSVVGGHGKIIEIQIRTKDMHHIAEEGIAAHWRYKGTERDKKFDKKISWLKQLLDWKAESKSADEFVETLKIDLFENEIVVFTPKGDPISLPDGSTPVDFAYEVHTNIGNHCAKAEVNKKLVPLDHPLKSGDIINIMTQKNAKPSRGWLNFVKTSKSRNKIRSSLNIKFDRDAKSLRKESETIKENLQDKIDVLNSKGQVKFSKCCNPEYGSPITAFLTKDKKITVHKKDCPNVATLGNNKLVQVKWKEDKDKDIEKMKVIVKDRVGMLAELLNVISGSKINVQSIYSRSKKDKVMITFTLQVPKEIDYKSIKNKVKSIKDVVDVKS